MATNQDSNNPMRRKLTGDGPIYIPFVVNLGFLLIAICFAVYNYTDSPSMKILEDISSSTLSFPAK